MNDLLRTLTLANAASVALALSDGTPVTLVKVTSKDNLQVRVPETHDLGAEDPLRIFDREGFSTKGSTLLTLVATPADAAVAAPAAAAPAPAASAAAPAPAVASNDNVTYTVAGIDGTYDSLDDAKADAIDLFVDTGNDVEIVATVTKVVGRVGFTQLAA